MEKLTTQEFNQLMFVLRGDPDREICDRLITKLIFLKRSICNSQKISKSEIKEVIKIRSRTAEDIIENRRIKNLNNLKAVRKYNATLNDLPLARQNGDTVRGIPSR